jgi:hypothetical protein
MFQVYLSKLTFFNQSFKIKTLFSFLDLEDVVAKVPYFSLVELCFLSWILFLRVLLSVSL